MRRTLLAAAAAAALALPSQAAMSDLVGQWDNADMRTGGVAQFDVDFDGSTVTVRAAGVCSPNPCDWGDTAAEPLLPPRRSNVQRDATGVLAIFEVGGATRTLIATQAGANRLQIVSVTVYDDSRPSLIQTETFRRVDRTPVVAEPSCDPLGPPFRIRLQGGVWTLTSGSNVSIAFDAPEQAGFARFLMEAYRPNQICSFGDGDRTFTFLTRNGQLPAGAQPGEDCLGFDWRQVRAVEEGGGGLVTDGRSRMAVLPTYEEAEAVVGLIQQQRAAAQCFVGRPDPGLTYLRR